MFFPQKVYMMHTLDILGYIAGAMTTISFIPQVVRTWKTKSTKDISLAMFILFCLGVATWMIYGIILNSWPIIVANGVVLVLGLNILVMKIIYK